MPSASDKSFSVAIIALAVGIVLFLVGKFASDKTILPTIFIISGVVVSLYGLGKLFYLSTPALNRRYGSAFLILGLVGLAGSVLSHSILGAVVCGFVSALGMGELIFKAVLHRQR